MRYPKNFAKLNSLQQEQWLVAKLIELHNLEQEIKKHKFSKPLVREEGLAMLVAISDLQLDHTIQCL